MSFATSSLNLVLASITFLSIFGLGVLVFLKNKSSWINRSFGIFSFGATIWILSAYLSDLPQFATFSLYLNRLIFAGLSLMLTGLFHFCFLFPSEKQPPKFFLNFIYSIGTILVFLSSFTPLIIKGVVFKEWGTDLINGPLFLLFIGFCSVCSLGLVKIFLEYRKMAGLQKTQIQYLFLGLFLFTSINIFIHVFLSAIRGSREFYQIGNYSTLFLIGTIAYAIVRYRLMNIQLVLGKGAIYVLSFVTVIALAFLLMFLNARLAQPMTFNSVLLLGAFSSLLFFQLIKFYERIATKYFYHTFYNTQIVIADLEERLTQVLELETLSSLILNTLKNTLKLEKIGILAREIGKENFSVARTINFKEEELFFLIEDGFLPQYLEKTKKPIVSEELTRIIEKTKEKEKLQKIQENLKRKKVALCLPLIFEEKIIGIIVLGNKISGETFFSQDIELLTTLSLSTSITLKNASLYSEVKSRKEELERFYRLTVGRELKMAELKKKIQELEEKLEEKEK